MTERDENHWGRRRRQLNGASIFDSPFLSSSILSGFNPLLPGPCHLNTWKTRTALLSTNTYHTTRQPWSANDSAAVDYPDCR